MQPPADAARVRWRSGDPDRIGELADGAASASAASPGAVAGRGWRGQCADRRTGRGHPERFGRGGPGSPRRGWRNWARSGPGGAASRRSRSEDGRDRGADKEFGARGPDALVVPDDGAKVGVSPATVQRVWAARGLKPHLVETFKLSTDPVRGEADRRRRAVPEPAGESDRAVHGREVLRPGAGPHPAIAADEAGAGATMTHDYSATAPPRCSPRWTC